jgi:uncharacterized delta-60 repeat protein
VHSGSRDEQRFTLTDVPVTGWFQGGSSHTWLATLVVAFASLMVTGAAGSSGGRTDPGFEGRWVSSTPGLVRNDEAYALAIQADGKIVAAGSAEQVVRAGIDDFALARYTADGRLDRRFGLGGKVVTDFGLSSEDRAFAVAIQADAKVVAAGSSRTSAGRSNEFALARYTRNGRLDASFGSGGKVLTDFGSGEVAANAVAIQADGKIVAAGSGSSNGDSVTKFALARYTADGILDPSFGLGGKVVTDLFGPGENWAHAVAIQADGKLVVAGTSGDETGGDFALARYTADGRLDPSFGSGGTVVTEVGASGEDSASALAIQADGKIVAAGRSGYDVDGEIASDFALARYTADGRLDPSFGSGGKVVDDLGDGTDDSASEVGIQPDGKLLAAGYSNTGGRHAHFALARYAADGRPDPGFGSGGKVLTDFGSSGDSQAWALAVRADGKPVAAGASDARRSYDFALAGYTADGRLDRSFGANGKVLTDFAPAVTRVVSMSARRTSSGVFVRWRTAAEVGVRGFNVYRAGTGTRVRANRIRLPSRGSANRGAAYAFLDRQAPRRAALRYWLQEVRRDGKHVWYGPAPVKR